MAMEGTHVRFALDLEKRIGITDRDAYFSGAVYPDSRYVTGIPRTETHGSHCPSDPFASGLSDFEKGWATHLVYDSLASLEKQTALAMIPAEYREDDWVFHSAIKLVEDRQSIEVLGTHVSLIQTVRLTERPRQEDEIKMVQYYQNLREAYLSVGTFDDYRLTSIKWGMPMDRVDRMIDFSRLFDTDEEISKKIRAIYPTVFDRYVLRSVHK